MTHAVLYVRFSPKAKRKGKVGEGKTSPADSCDLQTDLCRSYCEQEGYTVEAVEADRARSGNDEDRPGLARAIARLRRGWVLVVWRLDRLARDTYLSETICRAVEKKRARVEGVVEGANGESPADELMRTILQAFAQYERKTIANRTSAGMRGRQARGERMSRIPPYGWAQDPEDDTRLVEDPEEQENIEKIMEMHADGLKQRAIARALTAEGIPCRGNGWNHKLIGSIIRRAGE